MAEQLDELDDLDVEHGLAGGHGLDRCFDAFDIAAVIGAPDIDEVMKPAIEFVLVVGDVGSEIGI